jgi:hypothetical protein
MINLLPTQVVQRVVKSQELEWPLCSISCFVLMVLERDNGYEAGIE